MGGENRLSIFRSQFQPLGTPRQTVEKLADIHLGCNQTWLADRSGFWLEAAGWSTERALELMMGMGLTQKYGLLYISKAWKGFVCVCVCIRLSVLHKYGAVYCKSSAESPDCISCSSFLVGHEINQVACFFGFFFFCTSFFTSINFSGWGTAFKKTHNGTRRWMRAFVANCL